MVRKIEILPESISQIIAAGEVIERPASVVKELMENSIDAGSTEITVELTAGGLQSIRVTDNGEGMDPEDVPVALQRYATSKIKRAEDLFAIHTLGFRGEALPSIAQVSQMTIRTKTHHSQIGTEVISEGGEIKNILEIGCPPGTEVEVKNLFYNIPVKRKFLKSTQSELRAVIHHFIRLSLSHPSISFKLIHEGHLHQEHLKATTPEMRIEDVLGREIYHHLRPIEYETREIRITGFASLPNFSKRSSADLYFFVNGRFVKDRIIYKAVIDGYRHVLPNNQFPVVILFLHVPPSTIDVNVHPTKAEVKFKESEKIYQAVLSALSINVEGDQALPKWKGESLSSIPQEHFVFPLSSALPRKEASFVIQERGEGSWKPSKRWPYPVLGQIQGTYILCEGEDHLIFIDQHAAHERILFEKFKEEYENHFILSERLLLPILIELSSEESLLLESIGEVLKLMGFEIDSVGEKLFAIRSFPALIDRNDLKKIVQEILNDLSFLERSDQTEGVIQNLLVSLACHSAIRGNTPLRQEEMDQLLEQLASFPFSSTCPHGRPIFFTLPIHELKRQFKRK